MLYKYKKENVATKLFDASRARECKDVQILCQSLKFPNKNIFLFYSPRNKKDVIMKLMKSNFLLQQNNPQCYH